MDEPGQLSLFHLFRRSINPFRDEEAEKEPPPTAEEVDLLKNLEEYFQTTTSEVMTPRTQMCTLERDKTVAEAMEVFHKSGFSRIPVQDQKRDNIVGVLSAIDLFPYVEQRHQVKVQEIMRKPLFVSYSKPIHQLLTEFKKANNHMAIVIDEYGGVDGMITVTDIIEELVGDIPDESNRHSDPTWEHVEDGLIEMDATYALDEFNELYGTDFHKDGVETIGGYACHTLGKIPSRGEQFKLLEIQFTVEESTDRSIHKLKITAPPNS
ncbi:MAG: hemolysin family protein [bacterium]|nr:hemolysin family protein [bacterium]